ncbi:hypothetical protein L2E82_31706 [Cichorium intybus]|uniref:Uncharacterized protein n=1 Tax=Cichorium intybus TaxID=13427 RepID=A0ACB9BFI5_CICIN|nr:hypothetical protein L2E82_31706 [Cichorium intybus]
MKCSGGRVSPLVASSSTLLTAAAPSSRLQSLSYRQCYTHSLISTNTSKSESKLCMFTMRRYFVETSHLSSSEDTPKLNRCLVVARSNLKFPLISPDDDWGTWTALFATGAFGLCFWGVPCVNIQLKGRDQEGKDDLCTIDEHLVGAHSQ